MHINADHVPINVGTGIFLVAYTILLRLFKIVSCLKLKPPILGTELMDFRYRK